MKKSKSPSKKINIAEQAYRTALSIEFDKQNLTQDLINWNAQLSTLNTRLNKIEKVVKKELELKNQELHKEFLDIKTKTEKLAREIGANQKRFNKNRVKFEEKIFTPFESGEFNKLSEEILTKAQEDINKAYTCFEFSQDSLSDISQQCSNAMLRTAQLEESVNKLCVVDEVEDAVKINSKLNTRIKTLCEETAKFTKDPSSDESAKKRVTTSFLQLYKSHCEGEKLLVQLQKNLHIEAPDNNTHENNEKQSIPKQQNN